MSSRITYQNNIVTAKKFVQIGTGTVSARQRLRDVLTAYKEVDTSALFNEVRKMINDDTFEPSEKAKLKERWASITSSYTRLLQSLESSGLSGVSGEQQLKEIYSEVYVMCQNIFTDMDSASAVPSGFSDKWDSLQEQLNIVSQTYSNIIIKSQEFRLVLETNHYYPAEGETTIITATLYRGTEAYTESDLDTIMATIQWETNGLPDPDSVINGATITVPYDSFDEAFYVSATVQIPIEDL